MKHSFSTPFGVCIIGATALFPASARAQNRAPIAVAPTVALPTTSLPIVVSGGNVAVPVSTSESKVRLRLRNGAAYLDEETVKREGNLATPRLDAEPGLYTIRAFAPGKNGALVGTPLQVVVPGLRREAGVWLFNGSLWIAKTAPNANAPTTFLGDLKRGGKTKLPVSDATPNLLGWNAVPLDPNSGGVTPASGGPAVGYLLNASGEMTDAAQKLRDAGRGQALLLGVDAATDPLLAARQLENAARESDALVLKFDAAKPFVPQLWPLKMARRMAEETPEYDLPIFADVSGGGFSDAQLLEIFQNGATGFLSAPAAIEPTWARAWDANSNWLSGAVTIEDMGVLPSRSPRLETLLTDLRAGGRIPLVGQLPNAKNPKGESLFALLDDQTTPETLDGLKKAATQGQTLYLEGLPAPALYAQLGEITGTQIKPLAAPRDETLILDDPWIWGALNGREFAVTQRVSVEIKKSMAAQLKEQKGLALETIARPAGKLAGDPNGWLVAPVGKGRIFWMPHDFDTAQTPDFAPYYAAVAGGMQSALVSLGGDSANVRVALRATQGQTSLLGLFNPNGTPVKLSVAVRGDAKIGADLLSDKTLDTQVTGYTTQFETTVAAGGYQWLALAATQEDFDKERALKRVKARLK